MERNILDLSPNTNLVIDINMIWAVDINSQGDGCEVRIFPQGTSDPYLLKCGNKETAKSLFSLISGRISNN
jgi:hypothetical protein